MPGIFGTKASLLSDVNLLLQIAVLFLLLTGFKLARGKKLEMHGLTMATALILHTAAILLVMIPSLVINFGALANVSSLGVVITLIHVTLGIVTEATGIFLVVAWRLAPQPKIARNLERWMLTGLRLLGSR